MNTYEAPTMPEDHDPPNPVRDAIEAMLAYCDENALVIPDTIKTVDDVPASGEVLRLWVAGHKNAEAWAAPATLVTLELRDQRLEHFSTPVWFADWVVDIPADGLSVVRVRVESVYFEKPEYLT